MQYIVALIVIVALLVGAYFFGRGGWVIGGPGGGGAHGTKNGAAETKPSDDSSQQKAETNSAIHVSGEQYATDDGKEITIDEAVSMARAHAESKRTAIEVHIEGSTLFVTRQELIEKLESQQIPFNEIRDAK